MSVRNVVLFAALVGVSGCDTVQGWVNSATSSGDAKGGTSGDTPAEINDDLRGFVVLEHDTAMHRRPSTEAPALTLSFGTEAKLGRRFAAFELVETRGGWIRVRPLSEQTGAKHCAGSWAPLHDFDVALWVRTQRADAHAAAGRPGA
ncbi:MAG: hypothetical protein KUG77_03365, partial [Nannocystaceae bacterium]|nr:hypothetical protein [Nannocystaceae bacterium]